MAKIRHLPLQKYLRLRDIHGHTKACELMTQQEKNAVFNLIVSSTVPENYHKASGGFIIREDA
jgi:hypothetical protein